MNSGHGESRPDPAAESGSRRRRLLGWLISLLIPLVVLPLLVRYAGGLERLREVFVGLAPRWLVASLLVGSALQVLRALRFQLVFGRRIAFSRLLPSICLHYLMNRLLPMRTGEISFVLLVRRLGVISFKRGALTLLYARLLDLAVLIGMFLAGGALLLPRLAPAERVAVQRALSVMGVPLVLALALLLEPRLIEWLLGALFRRREREEGRLVRRVREATAVLRRERRALGSGRGMLLLLNTVAIWLLVFGTSWCILRAMHLEYRYDELVVGATFAQMSGILPVSGFGGFGSMELLWSLGYRLLGADRAEAVAAGFGVNLISLLIVALQALVAWVWIRLRLAAWDREDSASTGRQGRGAAGSSGAQQNPGLNAGEQ